MRKVFRLISLLVALALVISMATSATLSAQADTQQLGGVAEDGNLAISVFDSGTMDVDRYDADTAAWVEQIYSGISKGSRLQSSDGDYHFGGEGSFTLTGTQATPITNTLEGNTITTQWVAGSISVTQRTIYNNGVSYYRLEWDLTNITGTAITDLRFFHGEDTFLSGVDQASGFWITPTHTIGAQQTSGGELQRMMLQAVTEPFGHESQRYFLVRDHINAGALTNAVNSDETTDNGYALEWRLDTLGISETWSIVAYEKFIAGSVGALLVIAPTSTDCPVTTSCDLHYLVQNDTIKDITATLTITGDQAWGEVITSPGISATVPGNGTIPVIVRVTVPAGTPVDTLGNFTLIANDGTDDSSDVAAVRAVEGPDTDLAITKTVARFGTAITYTLTVQNLGPNDANGAQVVDNINDTIAAVTWTCTAAGGAACGNASGAGDLSESIAAFPAGSQVTFVIVGSIGPLGSDGNLATVTVPEGMNDTNLANNEARIGMPFRLLLTLIFR